MGCGRQLITGWCCLSMRQHSCSPIPHTACSLRSWLAAPRQRMKTGSAPLWSRRRVCSEVPDATLVSAHAHSKRSLSSPPSSAMRATRRSSTPFCSHTSWIGGFDGALSKTRIFVAPEAEEGAHTKTSYQTMQLLMMQACTCRSVDAPQSKMCPHPHPPWSCLALSSPRSTVA